MKKIIFAFTSVAMLAAASVAGAGIAAKEPAQFSCKVKTYGHGGWVPERTKFTFLDGGSLVEIVDPYVLVSEGEPVTAQVKQLKNGKRRFKWGITLREQDGTKVAVSYRADFDPEELTGRIKANIAFFPNGRMGGILDCQTGSKKVGKSK